MMVIGIDAHKRSHTAVTVDETGSTGVMAGRQLSSMSLRKSVMARRFHARRSTSSSTASLAARYRTIRRLRC